MEAQYSLARIVSAKGVCHSRFDRVLHQIHHAITSACRRMVKNDDIMTSSRKCPTPANGTCLDSPNASQPQRILSCDLRHTHEIMCERGSTVRFNCVVQTTKVVISFAFPCHSSQNIQHKGGYHLANTNGHGNITNCQLKLQRRNWRKSQS